MSGCHPTESIDDIREEEDVSPMVKKIQELENILNSFKQLFNDYQEDNGSWKLGVKGDIVSLNDIVMELEKRISLTESDMNFVPSFDAIIELQQSYQGLSCEIRDLQEKMRDVISSIRIKYPHKCPSCGCYCPIHQEEDHVICVVCLNSTNPCGECKNRFNEKRKCKMKYQEAVELVVEGVYVRRKLWETTNSYLAHLPGITNLLRVNLQPKPEVIPWAVNLEDSLAQDWEEVQPLLKLDEDVQEVDPA